MVGKGYLQVYMVPVTTGKNNEKYGFGNHKKRYFDIWTSFKKISILFLILARVLEQFENF